MKALASLALLALTLSAVTVARAQQLSMLPSPLDAHPTVVEFREEIARADIVARARITKILYRKTGVLADQNALVEVIKLYKGEFVEPEPCIRMEIYQSKEYKRGKRLADVGEEVILPIYTKEPHSGAPPPNGQKRHYLVPFYYVVEQNGQVTSAFGFPADMRKHTQVDRFERLITEAAKTAPIVAPPHRLGNVLLVDDFDDGSLAGWTFLEGRRGFQEDPVNTQFDVLWAGPTTVFKNELKFDDEPPESPVVRDPETGLYKAQTNHTHVEFGVADGRLRMRTSQVWIHLTAVIGDPEWTDYQIDVDVYNMVDREQPHARANYLKFGPYGRVHVPNFPNTRGEHSFIAMEVGSFANYDLSEGTFGSELLQIRCKYPEDYRVWRDHSALLRDTKVLDFEPWPIPQKTKIHLTAKYIGNYVEGWIDGKKLIAGEVPPDHPGLKNGRIALWTFETWAEWDNLKVTKIVRHSSSEESVKSSTASTR